VQNDTAREHNTVSVDKAPVITGHVGKKHCTIMLFSTRPLNTGRDDGCLSTVPVNTAVNKGSVYFTDPYCDVVIVTLDSIVIVCTVKPARLVCVCVCVCACVKRGLGL